MPRLNIYLPDHVYELADRFRDRANLSEICARAIKDELDALEGHRNADVFFQTLRPPTKIEEALAGAFGLVEAIVVDGPTTDPTAIRESLGRAAGAYLDRNISDGCMIALAGGRQMWCLVRNLSPRRLKAKITALGMHQADPLLLHAHPNTLATLLWILYSPRSEAYLIGGGSSSVLWTEDLPARSFPQYFVISSCSSFDRDSSFAQLLSDDAKTVLSNGKVVGDFAYVFFDKAGEEVAVPLSGPNTRLSAPLLRNLSRRSDARTVLVAAGLEKLNTIRTTLQAGVCNTLITNKEIADSLLE